ncbi:MAG: hypothetical protein QME51_00655 [Planctomycetota bacterium]|nr:hypothetical protein [Planctomycetota bacterium]MDI6786869.1 hypothetical protein [Planctomycetota bacterium]
MMRNLSLISVFLGVLLYSGFSFAVQTATWEISDPSAFRKGEMDGAILSADGFLTTGLTTTKIAIANQPITDEDMGLWCSLKIKDETYFGSAKGIIYQLNLKDNKLEEFFNTGEMLVTSMVVSSKFIFAGTLGNGKIFKIDRSKRNSGSVFTTLPQEDKYIWQLCFDNDANLYAGTGPGGKIYKIDKTGKAEVFYDTKKKNVLSLLFDGKDFLYAGTAEPGIVYRISLKGKPEIVGDFGDMEIKALLYNKEKKQLLIGANKATRMPPQQFLALIQESAKKSQTPPLPTQSLPPEPTTPAGAKNDQQQSPPKEQNEKQKPEQTPPQPQNKPSGESPPPKETPVPDKKSVPLPYGTSKLDDENDIIFDDEEEEPAMPEDKRGREITQPPPPVPLQPPPPSAPIMTPPVSAPPPPSAATTKPPVHCVIYILTDNLIKELISFNDCYLTEMKLNKEGNIIMGTDNNGRVYQVFTDGKFSIPYDLEIGQILTLVMDKENNLSAVGTGQKAFVYLVRPDLVVSASFTTDVLDAKFPARWGNFSFKGQGKLNIQTQSGNTAKSDETWSEWSAPISVPAEDSVKPTSPVGRFLKLKLIWEDKNTVIKQITQNYLIFNQQPKITEFKVAPIPPPPPTGIIPRVTSRKLTYQARDPDGDAISYRLYYRTDVQKEWLLLNQDQPGGLITAAEYNWITDSLPDGKYLIRLEATDEKVNPQGYAQKDKKISEELIVDNTRPDILFSVSVTGQDKMECKGKVEDSISIIRRIEYSLNGGKWELVFAEDGMLDSKSERFNFTLESALKKGFHSVLIRAFDASGNMGLSTVEFEKK